MFRMVLLAIFFLIRESNGLNELPTDTPGIREGDEILDDLLILRGERELPSHPLLNRKSRTDTGTSFRADEAECSEDGLPMKVKNIYYWPGENIYLRCKVCQRDLDSNKKTITWGWTAKVNDFFDHYQKNENLQHADIGVHFLQLNNSQVNTIPEQFDGSEDYNPFYMSRSRIQATEDGSLPRIRRQTFPHYGNTLDIYDAGVKAAGVYFCYDDTTREFIRSAFILHAMTPVNRVSSMGGADLTKCGNDCQKPIYMYPDTDWKSNWRPMIYKPGNEPICDEEDLECEQYLKLHPGGLAIQKVPETAVHLYYLERAIPESLFKTHVALAFRWEPWSKCDSESTHQRREGHCVLQFVDGENETSWAIALPETTRWMSKLNSIFKLSGGDNTGFLRLHSSTLMSMIMDEPVRADCGIRERSESVEKIDEFYEEVIFTSLDIPGERFFRERLTLNDEWRACFRYEHSSENVRNGRSYPEIVGTYVIEKKKCA